MNDDKINCPWCGSTTGSAVGFIDSKEDWIICTVCYGIAEMFRMKDGRLNTKPVVEYKDGDKALVNAARKRLVKAQSNHS